MKTYKIVFRIRSPLGTQLMADTLWGILCWGIKYFEGEKVLEEFLNAYKGSEPPLIISAPFPHGFLPVPKLTPVIKSSMGRDEYSMIKRVKKLHFLPSKIFFEKQMINMNLLHNQAKKLKEDEENLRGKGKRKTVARVHNTVDRLSNTVKENGLFENVEYWYDRETKFDIYLLTIFNPDRIKTLFSNAFKLGYGADSSLGKGVLEFVSLETDIQFPEYSNDDNVRGMALAPFIPFPDNNLENIYYSLKTKYGKLGGEYAIKGNPFKKPVLMYDKGTTFVLKNMRAFVGTLLDNMHSRYEFVRHYAYSPVIYFKEGE